MTDLSGILLAVDCDGTLLRNDQTISKKNMEAIEKFRALGGSFTIATGRSVPTGQVFLDQLHAKLPAVLYNGGMVYDPVAKKPLWESLMPEEAKYALPEINAIFGDDVGLEVLSEMQLYAVVYNDVVDEHLNGFHPIPHTVRTLEEVMPLKWYKALFAARPHIKEQVIAHFKEHPVPGARLVSSGLEYYELLPANANKGAALQKLCELKGFSMERTVTVGDFPNDIELVTMAGFGFCVANAVDELKESARMVAPSNEDDAVAWVIEYIINHHDTMFRR